MTFSSLRLARSVTYALGAAMVLSLGTAAPALARPEPGTVAERQASASPLAVEIGTYSELGYRSGLEHQQWTGNIAPWKYEAMATDFEPGSGQYKPWFAMYHNGRPGTITVDALWMYGHNRSTGQWDYLQPSDTSIGGAYWDPSWGGGSGNPGDGGRPMIYGPDGGLGWTTATERDADIIHGWANGLSPYDGAVYDGYLVTMSVSADYEGHTIGMGIDKYAGPGQFIQGCGVSAPWSVPFGTPRTVGVTNRPDLLKAGNAPF